MYTLVMLLRRARLPRRGAGARSSEPCAGSLAVGGRHRPAALHPLLVVRAARGHGVVARGGRVRRAGRRPRRAARRSLGALGVGRAHVRAVAARRSCTSSGTPERRGAAPVSPFGSWAAAFTSFGGNVHAAGWMLLRARAARRVRGGDRGRRPPRRCSTCGTVRGVRVEAAVAFGTVALGLLVGRADRHHVRGPVRVGHVPALRRGRRVRAAGVRRPAGAAPACSSLALALGAWGGISNVGRQRTQAYQLVPIIRDQAAPGDLVVFCPDAIGTDVVGRLRPDVRTTSFPNLTSSARVDWVDYADHVRRVRPDAGSPTRLEAARAATTRSGSSTPTTGTPADAKCAKVADDLALARPNRTRRSSPTPTSSSTRGCTATRRRAERRAPRAPTRGSSAACASTRPPSAGARTRRCVPRWRARRCRDRATAPTRRPPWRVRTPGTRSACGWSRSRGTGGRGRGSARAARSRPERPDRPRTAVQISSPTSAPKSTVRTVSPGRREPRHRHRRLGDPEEVERRGRGTR